MEDKKLQEVEIKFNTNAEETAGKVAGLTEKLDTTSNATEKVEKSQKKAAESSKSLAQNIDGLDNPIKSAVTGFKTMLVQMWAIVANPVGAILALIVGAVLLLGKAFTSTEAGGDKLSKGLAVITGLFSGLLKVLEPIASFLIDGIVKGFESAGNTILVTSELIQGALRAIGWDSAANGIGGVTKAITGNITASQKLADLEAKLVESNRKAQKIQLDYQNTAEKLRQLRDDETNSIPKRIELNNQLGAVLKKQSQEELKIAYLSLKIANTKIALEGKSTANLDAQAAARLLISDINERISGQESEQLANENSLRNESKAKAKEAAAEAKAKADAEKARLKVIKDAKEALVKEGFDSEKNALKAIQDLNDKSEGQKLARQKERALAEIELQRQKGIDVKNLLILNNEKFATLEQELFDKNKEIETKRQADAYNKDLEAIIANKDLTNEVRISAINEEQALLQGQFDAKILSEDEFNAKQQLLSDARKGIKQSEIDNEIKQEENKASAIAMVKQNLANISQNLESDVLGNSKAIQAAGKALALSQIGIDTALAVSSASKTAQIEGAKFALAFPFPGSYAVGAGISYATTGIQIASNVMTAKKLLSGGGGGGGSTPQGGGGGGAGGATSATPQVSFQGSSENQIGNTVAGSINEQKPIQAYVVSKEITTAQNLDNNKIKSNSL